MIILCRKYSVLKKEKYEGTVLEVLSPFHSRMFYTIILLLHSSHLTTNRQLYDLEGILRF